MKVKTRRPTRHFGTWMSFKSQGDGRWDAAYKGWTFTIEKRRHEPGCPAGWYYFGPGAPDGRYCGGLPEDAAMDAQVEAGGWARRVAASQPKEA